MKKLERVGEGGNGPKWARLNVREETHEKLVKVCEEQNCKLYEMVRFLVDLAAAGEIDFGTGE